MILEQLLDEYNGTREEQDLAPQEPWEVFDMIGGTSTGGYVISYFILSPAIVANSCKKHHSYYARSSTNEHTTVSRSI